MRREICVALIGLGLSALAVADNESTMWQSIPKSLSELLNEGWKIEGFTQYGIDWKAQEGRVYGDGYGVAFPEGTELTFILSKTGKYVICFTDNPSPNDAKSRCRALN